MIQSFKKIVLVTSSAAVFAILLGTAVFYWKEQVPQESQQRLTPLQASFSELAKPVKSPIVLMFAGDVMLDRGVEWSLKQNGEDWKWPFLNIAETLQKADLAFANLESQISDKGRNVGSAYSFRADPKSIEGLAFAGFDVVSVANNHSFDYTREAFEDSSQRLREAGIIPVADRLAIKEIKDVKIGFLAYNNFPGVAKVDWDNLEETIQNIKNAKSQVDILVVSLHAGEEYREESNEFQETFAQGVIDAGADLLIGHHPHVVQSLVPYTRGWIAYSLGNFVFDQDFSEETMQGAILKVVLEDKTIKEVSLLPTKLNSSFQVELVQ